MEPIRFPGLGLEFFINPVAFSVFGKEIYWYGIIISVGFILAYLFVTYEARRLGENPEVITDVVLWGTPAAIIGARLYYVIFNWAEYKGNPKEIIAIWHGGLAIYGAIIAALITALLYCNFKKTSFWRIADMCCLGLLIGQAVGRWGNFVNQEAYGVQTSLLWRMEIYDEELAQRIAVHPTFLYESLWNVLGFLILLWYRKRKKFNGEVFLLYSLWYSLGRFWIEGLRTDSLYWGNIRISQLVAGVAVIGSIIAIFIFRLFGRNYDENV